MARRRHSPAELMDETFRRLWRARLAVLDIRSQRQLEDRTGIPQSTISKRYANPDTITVAELRKLNERVGLDPEIVLSLVGLTGQ